MKKKNSEQRPGKNTFVAGKKVTLRKREDIKSNRIENYINKKAFTISLCLVILIALFVFKDFIFLKKLLLYKDIGSDTVISLYPSIAHYADYIHTTGFPKWSFNYGMGQNIMPFFLHDPFDIFLYIIGKDACAFGISYIEFIKVIAGGGLFYFYLKTIPFRPFTCIMGSLMFAFSGFMILNTGWYTFSFEAVNAALLLLAFEKLFKQNKPILIPAAIALIGISQPFNLYVYGLFILVYGTFRFLGEKGWDAKAYSLLLSKLFIWSLLGVAISCFFLIPNVIQMLESPRGSGSVSYFDKLFSVPMFATGSALHNVTALMRLFSCDLMGTGSDFKGWENYLEAPTFYTGILSLLLVPVVFGFLDKKRKIVYGVFLSFWLLPVLFPYFRYAFWLFTGDYYRAFSFFVALALLFLGLQALDKAASGLKIRLSTLIITSLLLLVIVLYGYTDFIGNNKKVFNEGLRSFTAVLIVIYTTLIYMLSKKTSTGTAKIFLLIVISIELCCFSYISVNKREIISTKEFESKTGYNDYTVEAVDYLKNLDKSFYRIDKDYPSATAIHTSVNDGQVQDYQGTSSYNQFNQKYYVSFLQEAGAMEKQNETESRWTFGLTMYPHLESIGNVKYMLHKGNVKPFNCDFITQLADVKIYKNQFYLPFGFTYDKYLFNSEFQMLPVKKRDEVEIKAFFVEDSEGKYFEGLDRFAINDTISFYPISAFGDDIKHLKEDTLAITDLSQNVIKGKIAVSKKKLLFLSIPFDKGWKAKVDDKEQEIKIVDAGMSGLLLEKGSHLVEMQFQPRFFSEGLIISIVALLTYAFYIWKSKTKKWHSDTYAP